MGLEIHQSLGEIANRSQSLPGTWTEGGIWKAQPAWKAWQAFRNLLK